MHHYIRAALEKYTLKFWSSLFNLFGRKREGGEQLHQYFDRHLSHGDCMRNLGIDLEAIQKMFDRLELINEGIVTGINVLSHLIRLNVTKDTDMGSLRSSRTEMRIARPVCIAFAGGNGYRMKVRIGAWNTTCISAI